MLVVLLGLTGEINRISFDPPEIDSVPRLPIGRPQRLQKTARDSDVSGLFVCHGHHHPTPARPTLVGAAGAGVVG